MENASKQVLAALSSAPDRPRYVSAGNYGQTAVSVVNQILTGRNDPVSGDGKQNACSIEFVKSWSEPLFINTGVI